LRGQEAQAVPQHKSLRSSATSALDPDAAQPWKLPFVATVFHLLVIEPLPVYTFYVSFITLLGEVLTFLELWYYDAAALAAAGDFGVVGKWLNCVRDDMYRSCFSLDLNFQGECASWERESDQKNYSGFVNLGCLVICLLVSFCPAVYVLWKREFDVCSGGYLACKWEFEGSRFYRVFAFFLVGYTVFTIFIATYLVGTSLSWQWLGDLLMAFLMYQTAPLVLLLFSAKVLATPSGRMPLFNYSQEGFRRLRFRRTWRDICFEDSTALARRLERAVLMGELGSREELEELVLDPDMAVEVLRMAALEAEGGGEDDDEGSSQESSSPSEEGQEGAG